MIDQLTPTQLLYLCLGAIALAGILVGWFARRIVAVSHQNKLVESARLDSEETRKELDLTQAREQKLIEELDGNSVALANLEKAAEEHNNEKQLLEVRIQEQAERVRSLESQVVNAEEQYVRGQQDFAKMRLLKAREVQRLQQQLDSSSLDPARSVSEEDLPVLSKRAGSRLNVEKKVASGSASTPRNERALPNITNLELDSDEDVLDMTSEFEFDADDLLAPLEPSAIDKV